MRVIALVPVKALARAKGRLSDVLKPAERRALVAEMLGQVVAALRAAPSVDEIVLVSPDPWEALGVQVAGDLAGDLNGALEAAVAGLGARPQDLVLVMAGDLPHVSAADVEALLDAARAGSLAIARDGAGQGTNALAFQLRFKPHFCFGVGSCPAHQAQAAELGVPAVLLDRPGLAFDVDDAASLYRFRDAP